MPLQKDLFLTRSMMYFVKAAKSTVEPRKKARPVVAYRHCYAQNLLNPGCVSHGRLSQAIGRPLKVPLVEPFY